MLEDAPFLDKKLRKAITSVRFKWKFHFHASNHFVTGSLTGNILFWKETLQAQCFYRQQQASVVLSVWEPKAAALQVNLPVWSQTACTLGQGRGDYTCVWMNTECVRFCAKAGTTTPETRSQDPWFHSSILWSLRSALCQDGTYGFWAFALQHH